MNRNVAWTKQGMQINFQTKSEVQTFKYIWDDISEHNQSTSHSGTN